MKLKKPFILSFAVILIILIMALGLQDIIAWILSAGILAGFAVVWAHLFYSLMGTEKWYYELIAVLMTGIIGAVILIGLQWTYHKLNLKVFD